jgi:putative hydrolase of the HAD superfamily
VDRQSRIHRGRWKGGQVWLFDLDDTLHDASGGAFQAINRSMTDYIVRELALAEHEADALRRHYWQRYGATLLGLIRHHGVRPEHFLHHTHLLPELEQGLRAHPHDVAALRRLPGRKYVLTNAPAAYARRVLDALGLLRCFDGVIPIERMRVFGQLRPKPDRRMFRVLLRRLRAPASQCVLVEDTLAHQKAARSLGLRTVWMLRWRPVPSGRMQGGRPVYVCDRIHGLSQLHRLRCRPPCPRHPTN